jgi:hypothetical protein
LREALHDIHCALHGQVPMDNHVHRLAAPSKQAPSQA